MNADALSRNPPKEVPIKIMTRAQRKIDEANKDNSYENSESNLNPNTSSNTTPKSHSQLVQNHEDDQTQKILLDPNPNSNSNPKSLPNDAPKRKKEDLGKTRLLKLQSLPLLADTQNARIPN